MDYHVTWYKCCPHWDDRQWRLTIPQKVKVTWDI